MSIFTYHLIKTSYLSAFKGIIFNPLSKNIKGLIHAEYMTGMTLGSPVFSTKRVLVRQVAIFAQWENEQAIEDFLANDKFGKKLAKGWYTKLNFIRQWGKFEKFKIPDNKEYLPQDLPVVAVTIARMKFLEIPRFIKWGRPVEKLVRDHPATLLSLATIRLPKTVSTFSIWESEKKMRDMVHGHSSVPYPKRHFQAMEERERKNFHFEFTTLRFYPISEFGEWEGKKNIISNFIKS
ncbi:hypothetical protein SAMN04488096_10672 [Mesonia phycicola]|uniref:Spheroidene monooxygenase n=1 Tax=Mesonia phycicola TaxID=579105 RepID=A0A1M6FCL6_9FLAO|nr:hypothetical protein [Mesonia phycicola]SHI95478.1 hypothetical protein SAMN04488096_10672 [Mesonia phycicola]